MRSKKIIAAIAVTAAFALAFVVQPASAVHDQLNLLPGDLAVSIFDQPNPNFQPCDTVNYSAAYSPGLLDAIFQFAEQVDTEVRIALDYPAFDANGNSITVRDREVARVPVRLSRAGEREDITTSWSLPSGPSPTLGNGTIRVTIDPASRMAERSETNNLDSTPCILFG